MQYHDPHDVVVNMDLDVRGGIATFKRTQEIPTEFLDNLRHARDDNASRFFKSQEARLACSLPGALVETWMAQGFNVYDKNVTTKDIVARLNRDGLTAFLASDKQF